MRTFHTVLFQWTFRVVAGRGDVDGEVHGLRAFHTVLYYWTLHVAHLGVDVGVGLLGASCPRPGPAARCPRRLGMWGVGGVW